MNLLSWPTVLHAIVACGTCQAAPGQAEAAPEPGAANTKGAPPVPDPGPRAATPFTAASVHVLQALQLLEEAAQLRTDAVARAETTSARLSESESMAADLLRRALAISEAYREDPCVMAAFVAPAPPEWRETYEALFGIVAPIGQLSSLISGLNNKGHAVPVLMQQLERLDFMGAAAPLGRVVDLEREYDPRWVQACGDAWDPWIRGDEEGYDSWETITGALAHRARQCGADPPNIDDVGDLTRTHGGAEVRVSYGASQPPRTVEAQLRLQAGDPVIVSPCDVLFPSAAPSSGGVVTSRPLHADARPEPTGLEGSATRGRLRAEFGAAPRGPPGANATLADLYRMLRDVDGCDPGSAGYTLSTSSLRVMRNTAFALHGYNFTSPDLSQAFGAEPWYTPMPGVSRANPPSLDAKDKACVARLRALEGR